MEKSLIAKPRRPRICVVVTTPLIIHFFLKPHLKALAKRCDVTLAVNLDIDTYTPPLDLPVEIVPIGIRRPIEPWHDLVALLQLFGIFRQGSFDLVFAVAPKAGLLAMIAAWAARVPRRVFVFQGEVWASKRGVQRWLLKTADRVTAWCASHLLAVSRSERGFLDRQGVVASDRVQVLGEGSICGVDLARYQANASVRAQVRQSVGIPLDATVVLFVGRLSVDKGVPELARAFGRIAADHPDLWFMLVGPDEGEMAVQLPRWLGPAADRTRSTGFSSTPEQYMAAADYIVLPSHREGFGMVIIEAGATGIPAVGSRIYGVSDAIVDGQTGLLFELGDEVGLARAMARLAGDGELRQQLGLAAQTRVRALFEQGAVVARYVTFLERLTGLDSSSDTPC